MTRRRADTKPTWTFLVIEALRVADDFLTVRQLMERTGGNLNQVTAALHHLKVNAKAVECMESDGHLYWYLTGVDLRTLTVDERVPEEPGNRRRRRKDDR